MIVEAKPQTTGTTEKVLNPEKKFHTLFFFMMHSWNNLFWSRGCFFMYQFKMNQKIGDFKLRFVSYLQRWVRWNYHFCNWIWNPFLKQDIFPGLKSRFSTVWHGHILLFEKIKVYPRKTAFQVYFKPVTIHLLKFNTEFLF